MKTTAGARRSQNVASVLGFSVSTLWFRSAGPYGSNVCIRDNMHSMMEMNLCLHISSTFWFKWFGFSSNGSLNLQSGIGILKSRIWNLTFQVLKFHVSQGLIWSSILEFNSGIWNPNWKYKHQCYTFTKLVRWKKCIHNISYEMHFDFSIKKHKSQFCTRSIPPYKRTFSFMSNVPSDR